MHILSDNVRNICMFAKGVEGVAGFWRLPCVPRVVVSLTLFQRAKQSLDDNIKLTFNK